MGRHSSHALLEAKVEEARQLEAEIRRLRNAARDRQRAADEQRQKIAGRVVLAHLKAEPESILAQAVRTLLATQLTRLGERDLFADWMTGKGEEPPNGPAHEGGAGPTDEPGAIQQATPT